jgi:D-amino-acid dehydrogenase
MPVVPALKHVAVIGGGLVGLSAAWFLQEQGVRVTVIERNGELGRGSSWGNAGWASPAMVAPLPEPAVLRYGLRSLVSTASPVYVPPTLDLRLVGFLARFAAHSTARQWERGITALIPLSRLALESFDLLRNGGVDGVVLDAKPLLAAFTTSTERNGLRSELAHLKSAGQDIEFELLNGNEARVIEPLLSEKVGAALQLHGQRFIHPGDYVSALARSFCKRGGEVVLSTPITEVLDSGEAVRLKTATGDSFKVDAVVLANGAWLSGLARRFAVRIIIQSGRGYSYSVRTGQAPHGPLYFPAARVACTPIGERMRIAGTMEFRVPDHPLDPRRIAAITHSVRPLLRDVDFDHRADEWVGPRPCTPDGLPVIGVTASPRVFVAGGHGMWGITLGPVTGRLLARQIVSGQQLPELAPFSPLR